MSAQSDELKGGLAAYRGSVAITPNDSTDLLKITRGVVADSGDVVKMTFVDGTTDTISLLSGLAYPFQVKRIWSAGTDATGIHALY
jgi:hypothetical protein